MFNKELAMLNKDRIGLSGVNGQGVVNEQVKIIEANAFRFVYAYDLETSVDIVTKSEFGENHTVSFNKGDELNRVLDILKSMA